jgi:PAS domain S-box-containing protein
VERIFGYTREELVGQNVSAIAAEPHRSRHPGYLERYRRTGERRIIGVGREVVGRKKDGTEFSVWLSVNEMQIEGRRVFVGLIQDVTARKRLEDETRQLAVFPETNPNIVARLRPDGESLYMNPVLRQLLADAGASAVAEALPAGYREIIGEVLERGVVVRNIEHACNGRTFSCQFTPAPDGESVYVFGQDITELTENRRRLQLAKEEAERANNAKSEFLASMSHELRTPLNAVIGFSDVLEEQHFGSLNEKQLEYVRDIEESGRHLLELINEILDLAKIEAESVVLDYERVDLAGLLRDSLTMIRDRTAAHAITLDVEIEPDISVEADARRLRQVQYNLLSNAAKFTPDGGRIRVSAHAMEDDAVVCVEDTGIGVDPALQEAIFEPFYQVRSDLSAKTPGTGLGLPLSRELVEMHGGRLWVESAGEGKGSQFCYTVPLRRHDGGPESGAAEAQGEGWEGKQDAAANSGD